MLLNGTRYLWPSLTYLCVAWLSLSTCSEDANAQASGLSDITATATRTTVYLSIRYLDDLVKEEKTTAGSGVLISDKGDVLTAYHVLKDWLKQPDEARKERPLKARIGSRFSAEYEVAFVIGDEQSDVALVRIRDQQEYPRAPLCYGSVGAGSYLFAFGYPSDRELTPVPGIFGNANSDDNRWEAAIGFDGGMSGGPVYNEKGFVIGIVYGGIEGSTTTSFITPVRWARSIIESRTAVRQSCFAECRRPEHGIEKWEVTASWKAATEWMGGGHSQPGECGRLQAQFMQTHPNQTLEIIQTDEDSKKDFLGHVTYQYICEGVIKANPLYVLKASPACGEPP